MKATFRGVQKLVEGFRVGREIPEDLGGRNKMDAMLAQMTDGLDRVFAALDTTDYRAVPAPDRVHTQTMVLTERNVVCHNEEVVRLTFRLPEGGTLAAWKPGSHLDLVLPSGRRRQYSLCGDPRDTEAYTIAVREVPTGGGGSVEMHRLDIGDRLSVTGPRNAFPFVAFGSALFVAGGIGMTAVIPMVRRARELGMDWRLVYSGRTRASLPFLDEVELWEPDRVTVRFDDEHGLPDAAELLADAPDGGAVYCCGPPPMIDTVRAGMGSTAATYLHYERFSAPPVVAGTAFEVELARTGAVVEVAEDRSMLDAIVEVLPSVPYSCRQGFCGTCRVRVLAGIPEHRDTRLTDEDRVDHMLACVSRSDGRRLVVDL
ncbi:PDR/VanB family oxidoreductase [Actinomycetes bacterium M1A6_2h]